MPTSRLGKWSAGLNIAFLFVVAISVCLVKVFGILNFDNRWWDVTVAILVPIELIALITGIIAISKNKDRAGWVIFSIIMGIGAILFALLHSLFISD